MDNIWIILLALLGAGFSLYNQSKKAQRGKTPKENEPKKSIFDTILSEFEEINQNPRQKVNLSNPKQMRVYETEGEHEINQKSVFKKENEDKNRFEKYHVMPEFSLNKDLVTENEIKDDSPILNEQKEFDLREAIILSSILYRQYN